MKSLFNFLFCVLFFTNIISAQIEIKVPSKNTETQKGIFYVSMVSVNHSDLPNIHKITYLPTGYQKSEKITNAVIVNPIGEPYKRVIKNNEEEKIMLSDIGGVSFLISILPESKGFRGFRINLQEGEMIYGGWRKSFAIE